MQFQKESIMANYRRSARDGMNEEPHASGTTSRDEDPLADVRDRLKALLNSRDYDEVSRMLDAYTADPEADDDIGDPTGDPPPGRRAEDSRIRLAMDARDAVGQVAAYRQALALVEPIVGQILAADSARAVMEEGIRRLGQDARSMHHTALVPVFQTLARQRHVGANDGRLVASVTSSPGNGRGISNAAVRRAVSRVRVI
jgi:hypothetical protein